MQAGPRRRGNRPRLAAWATFAWSIIVPFRATAGLEAPAPTVEFRLIHPDRQWLSLLELVRGSGFRDPAEALVRWKQSDPARSLGKPVEALIASLNPATAGSLRVLDGARGTVEPGRSGPPAWHVILHDESGIAADLLTALALTDGPPTGPIADRASGDVDRIGGPGSPLFAREGARLVVASDLPMLRRGLGTPGADAPPFLPDRCGGLAGRIDLERWVTSSSITERRVLAGLLGFGIPRTDIHIGLEGDALRAEFRTPVREAALVDRRWLDAVPEGSHVVASLGLAPDPGAWGRRFLAADRVEKADPAAAGLAPLRVRLAFLARAAGVRLDRDVLPHIRGITLALDLGVAGRVERLRIVLHAPDDRIAVELSALAGALLADRVRLPDLAGPAVSARGPDVRIDWGDFSDRPAPSGASAFRRRLDAAWPIDPPSRLGWMRPEALARFAAWDRLDDLIAASEPILWRGSSGVEGSVDRIEWAGLDRLARAIAARAGPPAPP